MPTELRKLVFSKQELEAAIIAHNRSAAEKLPSGPVTKCEVQKPDDVIKVALEVTDQRTGETHKIDLNSAYLAAALLRFCIEKKIPLPRDSSKSLQVVGDSLALNVTKNLVERKLPPKADPQKDEGGGAAEAQGEVRDSAA